VVVVVRKRPRESGNSRDLFESRDEEPAALDVRERNRVLTWYATHYIKTLVVTLEKRRVHPRHETASRL